MFTYEDEHWMAEAIRLAREASRLGEVPVGAILVKNNQIIAEGMNSSILNNDPTAHAEIITLRKASEKIGNYRLLDTTLYVTLEPCIMCAGALVHARIKKLIFGAFDLKAGAITSKCHTLEHSFLNHKVKSMGGLLALECGHLLSSFFKQKRSFSSDFAIDVKR